MRSLLAFLLLTISSQAFAYGYGGGGGGGGGWSLGVNLGIVNSSQSQINDIIKTDNSGSNGPISTSELNSAYEFAPFLMYRFSGTIYAVQFRPSFFYQKQDGSDKNGGSYDMSVMGWTFFPMLRLYPLESDIMKFYMQFGLGYGRHTSTINEGSGNSVEFAGGAFGSLVGLGAEFCFTPNHCMNLEGDYRYLTFERSMITKKSGTINNAGNSKGQEMEYNNEDLSIRMGGLMFLFGYTYWF